MDVTVSKKQRRLKELLETLPLKRKHNVMVPLGQGEEEIQMRRKSQSLFSFD